MENSYIFYDYTKYKLFTIYSIMIYRILKFNEIYLFEIIYFDDRIKTEHIFS